jgi:hypothetical protein
MKALLISLLIFINLITVKGQILWQKLYGGSGYEYCTDIQLTDDGGFIVFGYTGSNDGDVSGNKGYQDYWAVKIDSFGNIQWQKCFGGTENDNGSNILQTSDGNYLMTGSSISNDGDVSGNNGYKDIWIVKLNLFGMISWQKTFGGSSWEYCRGIWQTNDGGYILAGETYSNDGDVTGNHGFLDSWIIKLDYLGNIQWQKCLGGTGDDAAYSIQKTNDGGYILAGLSDSNDGDVTGNNGDVDYWIVKLDSSGNIQWQKSLGGSGNDQANSIQVTNDGGYIVGGISNSNDGDVTINHGGFDFWIVKLDNAGNIQWQKSLGGTSDDILSEIITTIDGGYIIAGSTESNDGDVTLNYGYRDSWIVKLNSLGNIQWQKSLGGSMTDWASSIKEISEGRYIIGGYSNSNDGDITGNHGGGDYWVVLFDSIITSGCAAYFSLFRDTTTQYQWYAVNQAIGMGIIDYTWNWGDGNSSTGAYPSHTYNSDGYYNICLTITDSNGCTDTYCKDSTYIYKRGAVITIIVISGVEDEELTYKGFSIFPNPVANTLNIVSYIQSKETIHYQIINPLGSIMASDTVNGEFRIDVSALPTGIYFLHLQTGNSVLLKRFLKE